MEKNQNYRLLNILKVHQSLWNNEIHQLLTNLVLNNYANFLLSWEEKGTNDILKQQFVQELYTFNQYYSTGVIGYLQETQHLLNQLKAQEKNNQYKLNFPKEYIDLQNENSQTYLSFEKMGIQEIEKLAFILVAGGLGERLGSKETKLKLRPTLYSSKSFLTFYLEMIHSLEVLFAATFKRKVSIPLIIMTSEATHKQIETHLQTSPLLVKYSKKITLLQQPSFICIKDMNNNLAIKNTYFLEKKPSGHGIIHNLLKTSNTINTLKKQGKEHLFFLQDTNLQVINIILPCLGVLKAKKYDFLWIGVKRNPQEKMGGIVEKTTNNIKTIENLEYNLISNYFQDKQENILGNTNTIAINISAYNEKTTKMPSFINPKFKKDATEFKSACRIESLMQDFSSKCKIDKVGICFFDRLWAFSAMKNPIKDTLSTSVDHLFTPISMENDYFSIVRKKLSKFNNQFYSYSLNEKKINVLNKIIYNEKAKVIIPPLLESHSSQISIKNSHFHPNSCLMIESLENIEININNLCLQENSSLIILSNVANVKLFIENITIENNGFEVKPINEEDLLKSVKENNVNYYSEEEIMRALTVKNKDVLKFIISKSGHYTLKENALKKVILEPLKVDF